MKIDVVIPALNEELSIARVVESVLCQQAGGCDIRVIVVDNGSIDNTRSIVEGFPSDSVACSFYDEKKGRSAAINHGVARSSGDYILVLDADCILSNERSIQFMLNIASSGVELVFGFVVFPGQGFWSRYSQAVLNCRLRGGIEMQTSANMLISRRRYQALGGFSECYSHYGFEDKDFICQYQNKYGVEQFEVCQDSVAEHSKGYTIADMTAKAFLSGKWSSGLYRRRCMLKYKESRYAKIDARLLSGLKLLVYSVVFEIGFRLPLKFFDWLVMKEVCPDKVSVNLVKFIVASFYFKGTSKSLLVEDQ